MTGSGHAVMHTKCQPHRLWCKHDDLLMLCKPNVWKKKKTRKEKDMQQKAKTNTEHTKIIGIQKEVSFRSAQNNHKGIGNTRKRVAHSRTPLSLIKSETTRWVKWLLYKDSWMLQNQKLRLQGRSCRHVEKWLQTTQPTSGGAVTANSSCCANCVEPPRPQQWGPDLPFFGHVGVVVSVMLVVCSLSVLLYMCQFVLCVLCLTVLVNCLLNAFTICVGEVNVFSLKVMVLFLGCVFFG